MTRLTKEWLSTADEIAAGDRFAFGKNWRSFHQILDEDRIADATESLQNMLAIDRLDGKTFLDIGSGSGLFSLAARRLGATVHSFDFDPDSVSCTALLKSRFAPGDSSWKVEQGSVLDDEYMASLGQFDVVYSWGVLHHTGAMWKALETAQLRVAVGGLLFVALYNDQGRTSRYWHVVKKLYCSRRALRPALIGVHFIYPLLPAYLFGKLRSRKVPRGMSIFHDFIDWLGGYPFEVASPDQVVKFYELNGFKVETIRPVGKKMGCNEFVFRRQGMAS